MSGDVGAEVAAVLAGRMSLGTSGRWIAEYGETPETLADALAPLIAVRVEAAKAEAWELADAYRERYFEVCDQLREANGAHDALGAKLASIKAHPSLKCECRGGPHGGYTCEWCSA